jgi:hypothetical protein
MENSKEKGIKNLCSEERHLYIETTINNCNDLFQLNQNFMSQFIFRGQANSEWKLKTSLERLVERLHPNNRVRKLPIYYEQDMIDEFKWKYPIYEKNLIPQKDEYIEWLSLMQHYGAPTRMLDFSYSLYVALFMAIDNSYYDNSSIWAINKNIIGEKSFLAYREKHKLGSSAVLTKELDNYIYECANKSISSCLFRLNPTINNLFEAKQNNDLFIVRPRRCNERINRQQGLFVIPDDICVPFEEILQSLLPNTNSEKIPIKDIISHSNDKGRLSENIIALLKINIPKELRLGITNSLRQMNITCETMYPGIEGLAKSLSRLRESLGDYKQ